MKIVYVVYVVVYYTSSNLLQTLFFVKNKHELLVKFANNNVINTFLTCVDIVSCESSRLLPSNSQVK